MRQHILMVDDPLHRAVYLTGPTASGKTAVGVELARRLDAEIISLDSMALYRGMSIGTAKPTIGERRGVPHHLIDVLDPWESANVAWFRIQATAAVESVLARGRIPLFVGGTPLYLKACLRGLFEGPPADPELRRTLEAEETSALHQRLALVDPLAAARLHENDRRRVIRALEVQAATNRALSDLQIQHNQPAVGVKVAALQHDRSRLYQRIDHRVMKMFDDGFLDEVRALQETPKPLSDVAAQGVGYREVIDLLEGRATIEETIERIQTRTRQFAKRQETWFRGLAEVSPWPVGERESSELVAERLADWITSEK
jgi:tRNA dimethylallyltransferase